MKQGAEPETSLLIVMLCHSWALLYYLALIVIVIIGDKTSLCADSYLYGRNSFSIQDFNFDVLRILIFD